MSSNDCTINAKFITAKIINSASVYVNSSLVSYVCEGAWVSDVAIYIFSHNCLESTGGRMGLSPLSCMQGRLEAIVTLRNVM